MKSAISPRRYLRPVTLLAAALSGGAVGIACSFFWTPWVSVGVGALAAVALAFLIPLVFSLRSRAFDAPAASHGDALLCNEPVIILSEKRRMLGRLCLTGDTLYLYFMWQGRVAFVSFSKASRPLISYGQSREFLSVRAADGRSGAYISSDDLLSNVPHIYEVLRQNGWHLM